MLQINWHFQGFRCFNHVASQKYITFHAQFDESCFPFANTNSSTDAFALEFSQFLEPHVAIPLVVPKSTSTSSSRHVPFSCSPCLDYNLPSSVDSYLTAVPPNSMADAVVDPTLMEDIHSVDVPTNLLTSSDV